ncbi:hypothetical protein FOG51_03742 [Hanseniaspora uvarum]|uniref:Golgin IMH1 n=1 Tax=Hanseniaspora uvarum TaxID=29833 RepID=A0A1E5RJE1_HANUV|nr:hypothetical protein FOG51_03742 [Hanseniaspora uvarum]KAF0277140.1 hypothetical protein FOG50_01998 [Hanseniaspora uvarum]OEJ86997.1 Golgin IMH1 [Hanseniaspora uvarum]GMM39541.1 Imh1 protein [Hanseniaspora uvarum]
MFKNLNQIGSNLSTWKEELSKQVQERKEDFNEMVENYTAQQNSSSNTLPEHYKSLPVEVQNKLLKFMKYEEKYPLLLKAYKSTQNDISSMKSLSDSLEEENQQQKECLDVIKEHYVFEGSEDLRDFLNKWTQREQLIRDELNMKNKEIAELKKTIETLGHQKPHEQVGEKPLDEGEKIETKEASVEPVKEVSVESKDLSVEVKDSTVSKEATEELKQGSGKNTSPTEEKERSAMQWKIKYNSLEKDLKSTRADYFKVNADLKIKIDEINNMKEMLKEVGNQLVEMKDKEKQVNSVKMVEETKYKSIVNANRQLQAANSTLTQEKIKLEKELEAKSKELATLAFEHKQLNMKTNRLNNKVEEMMSEKQASQKTISDLNKKLEDIIKENGKLEERSLIIKEKYQQEESVKSTSNEIVESLTNQCNEMNIKLKEIMNLKSTLEDEVTQKNDRLYAQKRDIQNLNDQVLSLKNKNSDLEMTITKLEEAKFSSKTSANDEMIKELQKILDNKIIEINSLNETLKVKEAEIISLNERLSALEYSSSREKQANLSQERKVSTNLNSEQILDQTIKNLKEELSSKTKSLKNLEATLFNLRKLNKDLNFKLDKMNKIYQQQRISASPSNSRKSSEAEIGSTGDSDLDSKLSYIKNVLIGFIEHRDQRQQLLPVISMLLKFNTEDQKILMSLK